MMKKGRILLSVLVIALAIALVGGATASLFSDTAAIEGNTFSAGTLELEVDGEHAPQTVSLSDMKPGDDTGYYKWVLKNTGSLPGKLSVSFSEIINNDNGLNYPETVAEESVYGSGNATGGDEYGKGGGELGQYLKYTIGWAPKGWDTPSQLESQWQAGPPHSWGTPGLNGLGGKTKGTINFFGDDVLKAGEEVQFMLTLYLDENLQIWDGTKWVEVDDNIIQSDSVEFDITFSLVQAD